MEEFEKARARAMHLVKIRPRSEAELKDRLLKLRFSEAAAGQVVEEFKARGLVDDAKFARYFAEQKIGAGPVGRRALLEALKSKGIRPETACGVVEEVSSGRPELEMARELAAKRAGSLQGLKKEAVQRRLFGYLSRRGFSSDVVYKVVREFTE
ncbi:MAG: recombination regulator RecX [Candidatus Omnitrophica bacterium]|nr:recombination regulator RecX [Candidatus Omnitrophota bacterium]